MVIAEAEQRRYVSHMKEVVTVRILGSQQGLLPLPPLHLFLLY